MSQITQSGVVLTIDGVSPVAGNIALTSNDGSITITPGIGTIDLEAAGSGGGITTLDGDVGSATGTTVNIVGTTSGAVFTGATDTLTLSFDFLDLPATTTALLGFVEIGNIPFLHGYGAAVDANVFVGGAGNFTLTPGTSTENVGVGSESLGSLTLGDLNTSIGVSSQKLLTQGTLNTSVGHSSLSGILTGDRNIAIGYNAGVDLNSSESDNILIGNVGVVGDSDRIIIGTTGIQTDCSIAGIYGNAPITASQLVYTDTTGNLSAAPSVYLPNTTTATAGIVFINNTSFMHAYGGVADKNTFVGTNAGNFTLTPGGGSAQKNTGVGSSALISLTTGFSNCAIGSESGVALQDGIQNTLVGNNCMPSCSSGQNNTAVGQSALVQLGNGNNNVVVGYRSGLNYTGTESNNVIIGASINGTLGESSTTRIGETSTAAYIGGIYGNSPSGTSQVVYVDTDGSLSSSVSSGSVTSWTDVSGTTQALAVNSGYAANNGSLVTLTLPATAIIGSLIVITGKGAGGWKIAQNSGQTIYFGSSTSTTGVAGFIASTLRRDGVYLRCITANTEWQVESSVGNITVS